MFTAPLLKTKVATFLNNKGLEHLEDREYDSAIALFKKSLLVKPLSLTHYNLGEVYREQDKITAAVNEYEQAIGLDEKNADAYYQLVEIYMAKGRYGEAIEQLLKVQRFDPKGAGQKLEIAQRERIVYLFNEAGEFYLQGNNRKALERLQVLIRQEPSFKFSYKLAGDIYLSEERMPEALLHYKKALGLGLEDAQVYNNLGIIHMTREEYPRAVMYLREAYYLKPHNINIVYNLASTLRDNKELREALELFKKVVQLKYDYFNVHNDMAEIYMILGDREEAIRQYRKELKIIDERLLRNPADLFSLTSKASAYNGLGRHEEAKKIIDEVIRRNPYYGEAYFVRARIETNLGNKANAKQDLLKAKKFFPSSLFIDEHIRQLGSAHKVQPQRKEVVSPDTLIRLQNGNILKGRLKRRASGKVYLEMMIGSSIGTIGIPEEDIESLKTLGERP